jgi:hypothetical protein
MKAVAIALLAILPAAVAPAQDLAVTHATVYASPETLPLSDATVVIRHGMISGVGQHLRTPKGIETIACHGCVVLAGFWNAHVHFMEAKWNDAAHQPAEKLTHQMSEMLTHSGFTTVVDTGSDGENTIALRRRMESGDFPGPRIFTAGIPIFPAHALPYYDVGRQQSGAKMKLMNFSTAVAEPHRFEPGLFESFQSSSLRYLSVAASAAQHAVSLFD